MNTNREADQLVDPNRDSLGGRFMELTPLGRRIRDWFQERNDPDIGVWFRRDPETGEVTIDEG